MRMFLIRPGCKLLLLTSPLAKQHKPGYGSHTGFSPITSRRKGRRGLCVQAALSCVSNPCIPQNTKGTQRACREQNQELSTVRNSSVDGHCLWRAQWKPRASVTTPRVKDNPVRASQGCLGPFAKSPRFLRLCPGPLHSNTKIDVSYYKAARGSMGHSWHTCHL